MEKIAVAVVKNHNNEILLVRRRQKEGNLQWQFPSGKIENNEQDDVAMTRETFEETGVICNPILKFGQRQHPEFPVEIHYWLAEHISGEAYVKDDEELDMVEWCLPQEVVKRITSSLFPPIFDFLNSLK